jgi:hydrogenase maturation protease
MAQQDGDILILGIGNVLMRDEGVGAHVARHLAAGVEENSFTLPPRTRVVDGGTLGLDLLPMISEARAVVFVDAVDFGGTPGEISLWHGVDLERSLDGHISAHEVGAADLLALGRLLGTLPARVALVGIQPAAVEVGLEMTSAVEIAVPIAAAVAARQAEEFHRAEAFQDA